MSLQMPATSATAPPPVPLTLETILEPRNNNNNNNNQQGVTEAHVRQALAVAVDPKNAADARRRLMRDLKKIQENQNSHFSARPIKGDLFHWSAVVLGPDNTPWESGIFKLRLDFTDEYPCAPPTARFLTRVFHPNVHVDGHICLDTLKTHWSPALDVEALLLMIISLLSDPNPNSAANGEAANVFTKARDKYEERVRQIVEESLEQEFSEDDDE